MREGPPIRFERKRGVIDLTYLGNRLESKLANHVRRKAVPPLKVGKVRGYPRSDGCVVMGQRSIGFEVVRDP